MNESMANPVVDAINEISSIEEEVIAVPFEEEVVEDVQEALDNIEANDEADPTPLIIDVDTIPDGMTPTEVTEVWTQTSYTVISGNDAVDASLNPGAVYRAQFAVNLRGDQGVVLNDVTVTPVKKKRAIVKAKQEKIKEAEERAKKREIAKKKKERRSVLLHTSYVLQPNDLMILLASNGNIEMIKTDTQRSGTIKQLYLKVTAMCPDTGIILSLLNNRLLFDKNMNPLSISYSPFKEKSMKGVFRFDHRNFNISHYVHPTAKKKWIIVDKKVFMESNGKKFRIKHRVGFTMLEVLKIKRKINSKVKEAELFIEHIRTLVSGIYDEEHYEIIYNLDFKNDVDISTFSIYLQFPDLLVSNSIEMTHTIDNLITKMDGEHYKDKKLEENTFRIFRGLSGIRTTFTPEDAYYGYSHSHLPNASQNWNKFCMGDNHFMSRLNRFGSYSTDIELEMILIGVLDHISWESLEGGPYIKMENIGGARGEPLVESDFEKSLKVHDCGVIKRIFRSLKQKNLTPLMKAFTLKMQSNKEVTYVLDKYMFVEQFLKIFSEDNIKNINCECDISTYKYIPSQQQFLIGGKRKRPKEWKDMVSNARARVYRFPIAYINGKYIRPQVIKTNDSGITVENEIITFHPKIIFYVANIIHYHLLNELKNVKK